MLEISSRTARSPLHHKQTEQENQWNETKRIQPDLQSDTSTTCESRFTSKSEYLTTLDYMKTWSRIKNNHVEPLLFFSVKESLGIFSDEYLISSRWSYGKTLKEELVSRNMSGRAFSNLEQISIAYGIISGVAKLHKEGICHGNIRPEYIVLRKSDGTQIKSSVLPNFHLIGGPFITAQRWQLADQPDSEMYVGEATLQMLKQKRGPWVRQDPNRDIQCVGYMLLSCFGTANPTLVSLCNLLISVPDEPSDWSLSTSLITGNGPLSDLELKRKIKYSMELDANPRYIDNPQTPSQRSRDVSTKIEKRSIDYEATPPVKIKTIERTDLSVGSRRSPFSAEHRGGTTQINFIGQSQTSESKQLVDERNSDRGKSRPINLNSADSSVSYRRPLSEWIVPLTEVRPQLKFTSLQVLDASKDRDRPHNASFGYDSFQNEQTESGVRIPILPLTGGLESSRYTIQMGTGRSSHDQALEKDYIRHADQIKQQIQTYGPKDEGISDSRKLRFSIEESPLMEKQSDVRVTEGRQDLQLRMLPIDNSGRKSGSYQASNYYNSSYFEGDTGWAADPPHLNLSGSQTGMVRTVGKYSAYTPDRPHRLD